MFFSWLFLFFLACHGLSGAASENLADSHGSYYDDAEDSYGGRSLYGSDAEESYLRANPGPKADTSALVAGSLQSSINLMKALVQAADKQKRSPYSLRSQTVENDLNAKLKETEKYAEMLKMQVSKEKQSRALSN